MFVLVTFSPPEAAAQVAAILGQGNRAFFHLPGAAYVAQVLDQIEARQVHEELDVLRAADPTFDFVWFRVSPTTQTAHFYPRDAAERPQWDFALFEGIVRRST